MKSAYDLAWREHLLLKLSNISVHSILLGWFKSFLSQRICKARYEGCYSKYKILRTGLPQGSVSSCLFFNLYINDLIAKFGRLVGVECLLYANDLVLWTETPKYHTK
ncbi:reverse transcriptase domain-containing protein [Trichonephila clavipes]|uniref:Reverse transcriptase domain-containing protein n=1 Tax=Trichonephila clavipes TaxID=2585209 RepID=A0A8X6SAH5_TRICX|nr:reverse transcriptase domain-containing protein [Trichonephila clavipes]